MSVRRQSLRLRRRGERQRGAVMAMVLLFVLFCAGLMFAVAGIGESIEYRESLQQAADMGALALAQRWAAKMNLAREYDEDEWAYVKAAMMYEMMERPQIAPRQSNLPWAAPSPLRLQPCVAASAGGGGIRCDRASAAAQQKAGTAATRLQNHLKALFKPTSTNGLRSEMSGFLNQLVQRNSPQAVRYGVSMDWVDASGQGPGQEGVLKCQGSTSLDPDVVYSNLLATPSPGDPPHLSVANFVNSWLSSISSRGYWNTCPYGGQGTANGWCTNDGARAPIPWEWRIPKAYGTAPTVSGAAAKTSDGFRSWVPTYLGYATSGYSPCLATFIRDPEQFRVVVRAVGEKPEKLGTESRNNVFIGAFSSSGSVDVVDAQNNIYFTKFIQAGQFALSQASFGLVRQEERFVRIAGTTAPRDFEAAFDREAAKDPPYSEIPLHLWGRWDATLTRIHYTVGGGAAIPCPPGVRTGCNNGDWATDAAKTMVH
jgi:hypothetical protein